MGVINGILIALGVILIIAMSRSITTFIHELGHAIPALLFTKNPVQLVVGSYGDPDSYKLHIGRLHLWFKYNPLGWYSGLCSHERIEGLGKTLMVIVGGPLASLLLSIGILLIVINGNFSDGQVFLFSIFILSGLWDFCVNMYPSDTAIPMSDGGQTFCDGRQLLNLIQLSGHSDFIDQANQIKKQGNPEALFTHYDNYLQKTPNRIIAVSMVEEFLEAKRYQDALDAFSIHLRPLKRKNSDFLLLTEIYHSLKNNHEALRCIEQYLFTAFHDLYGINKRGEINLDLDNLEDAYKDLNYAYVLTKKEEYAAAGPLVDQNIELLNDAPRQQFYAGFYYMKTNQNEKALKHFLRAKELDWEHHGLNYYINEVD